MKALRRSLNSDKSHSSHVSSPSLSSPRPPAVVTAPTTGTPFTRVAPPQKVIKAVKGYKSDVPLILSYEVGDFFYVAGELEGDERCPEGWYQALNPLTGSRGRVPRTDFEEFHKGGRNTARGTSGQGIPESGESGASGHGRNNSQHSSRAQSPMTSPQTYQPPLPAAVPLPMSRQPSNVPSHAPQASTSGSVGEGMTRADGEEGKGKPQPLYAVVQYDFAAERPDELDAKAGEPIIVIAQSNHEWFVAKPIGRLGGPGLIPVAFVEIRDPVTSRPIENVAEILAQGQVQRIEEWKSATARYKESSIPLGTLGDFRNVGMEVPAQPAQQVGHDSATQPGALVNGDVISTHVKSFHYEANAYWFRINALFLPDDPSAPTVSLVLYRLYEDFYNFQITLLDLFPREAGRTTRTSDASARDRRSGYQGTGRILPYMPGPCDRVDVDITNERRKDLDLYLYELLELRSQGAGYILRHEHVLGFFTPGSGDMTDTIDREEARVIARQVAEAGAAAKRTAIAETMSRGSSMRQSRTEDPRASGLSQRLSGLRFSDGNPAARSSSSMGHSQQSHGPSGSITRIPGASATSPVQRNNLPQTASTTTSFSRAGPPSNTTHAPSQSANAPQPAYIKIKILDRHTDDMVAIRVPPRVTYDQLLDKVRDRLGVEISVLQYRVGQGRIPGTEPDVNEGQEFGDVRDDSSLWDWLEAHEKYVLYAE